MKYIAINFKQYVVGNKTISLARKIHAAKKSGHQLILIPPFLSLQRVAKIHQPTFAQHVDAIEQGAHTGSVSVAELKRAAVQGALLNHAERKIPLSELKVTLKLCAQLHIRCMVCASSIVELQSIAKLKPTFIAYEPQRLIGTQDAVTDHPGLLQKAKSLVHKISPKSILLCGAGIHSKEDVKHAFALGFDGVLLSHAVCTSKDPAALLRNFMQ